MFINNFNKNLGLTILILLTTLFSNYIQAQSVWINEFSYDPAGTDTSEFIEIAGISGTELDVYKLVFYNGSDSSVYYSKTLSDTLKGTGTYATKVFHFNSKIQNGAPDAIALVYNNTQIIQFISYEGTILAKDGAATGLTSTDVGVTQNNNNNSIQASNLDANLNFKWILDSPSLNNLNPSQLQATSYKDVAIANELMHQSQNELYFNQNVNVTVFSLIGTQLFTHIGNKIEFNKSGIYFIKGFTTESKVPFKTKIVIP